MTLSTPEQLEAAAKLLGANGTDASSIKIKHIVEMHAKCAEALRQAMQSSKKNNSWKSWFPGQEVICPDGIGRVVEVRDRFPQQWVKVSTYVNDRQCEWAPGNVRLTTENDTRIKQLTAERDELRAALRDAIEFAERGLPAARWLSTWRELARKE